MSEMTVTGVRAPRAVPRRKIKWRPIIEGYLFCAPFLIGVIAFWAAPMLYSVALAFMNWDLLQPPQFAGFANITKMLADPLVGTSLYNTAFFTLLGVPIHLVTALILAIALNVKLRGVSLYRTIFYLPSVTPAVASAVIWVQILHNDYGILNAALQAIGLSAVRWLTDPTLSKPAFILMTTWTVGPQMVIFLAGLQGVPEALHEAAAIDGANTWQRFWNVTIPMLSPVIFFNLVIGIIGSFQVFTAAFIMTGGGPQNSTLFAVLYIYQNGFQYFSMGYAAALAWMLCWIIMIFTFLQFRLARQWVYYEAV